MSAQLPTLREKSNAEAAHVPEAASSHTAPTEITTRQRLVTLRLVREGSFSAPSGYPSAEIPIRSPRDVFDHMEPYAEREACENFWILPLDSQHQLIGGAPTVITRGILNSSLVHPREVFCAAIVAHAAAVVLCHNHPSGDPTPSPDDRTVTDQLAAAGRLLDIPVHDHVIIGRGRYVSFAEAGLL
jgi:DNA repair protein RadC